MFKTLTLTMAIAAAPFAVLADSHVTGDASKGEKVFRKCKACHAVGEDAKNKAGPVLNGVVDRSIATGADFAYSDALLALGADGKTWTPEELSAFLTKPRDYAKGTKMNFAGLRKEEDRINLIAYLASFPGEGG